LSIPSELLGELSIDFASRFLSTGRSVESSCNAENPESSDYYDGGKNIFPKDKLSETDTEKSFICQAGK
jgi:hypothetical protein